MLPARRGCLRQGWHTGSAGREQRCKPQLQPSPRNPPAYCGREAISSTSFPTSTGFAAALSLGFPFLHVFHTHHPHTPKCNNPAIPALYGSPTGQSKKTHFLPQSLYFLPSLPVPIKRGQTKMFPLPSLETNSTFRKAEAETWLYHIFFV